MQRKDLPDLETGTRHNHIEMMRGIYTPWDLLEGSWKGPGGPGSQERASIDGKYAF